jgi:hypothetical protein
VYENVEVPTNCASFADDGKQQSNDRNPLEHFADCEGIGWAVHSMGVGSSDGTLLGIFLKADREDEMQYGQKADAHKKLLACSSHVSADEGQWFAAMSRKAAVTSLPSNHEHRVGGTMLEPTRFNLKISL